MPNTTTTDAKDSEQGDLGSEKIAPENLDKEDPASED